ncbi:tat pathway signal sequence protein [Rutstroemia sp. NJR-2017a BBW]|nr:tat pathway signal sequence protein [Rutstroemia sp. NJR-2017a BBW]
MVAAVKEAGDNSSAIPISNNVQKYWEVWTDGELTVSTFESAQPSNENEFDCEIGAQRKWEHTPEWSYTSKLLISKHQQVQLLEAASVLVNMNQNANTPPDSAKDFHSDDQDSASPTASGSEDHDIDGASSADTTPPPADIFHGYGSSSYTPSKRYSNGHGYARSYQSSSSNNYLYSGSVSHGFGHHRQQSHERRPPSSGMNDNQEDEGLSTAIELLSCSFGTPRSGLLIPDDAPPVPDIPAQYLNDLSGTHFTPSLHPRQTESYTRHQIHIDEDVKMEESEDSIVDDEDYDRRSRARSDEDDDGVFGRMEE